MAPNPPRPLSPAEATKPRRRVRRNAKGHYMRGTQPPLAKGGPSKARPVYPPTQDVALKLLQELNEGRLDPRDLTDEQRRCCLLLANNGTKTPAQLAAVFKVSRKVLNKDLRLLREEVGRDVCKWSAEEVVGYVTMAAEVASSQALKQKDPATYWAIHRDHVKLLHSLGLIQDNSEDSLKLTIEAVGRGYARASRIIAAGVNRSLAGFVDPPVIDAEATPVPPKGLPLERRLASRTMPQEEAPGDPPPRDPL